MERYCNRARRVSKGTKNNAERPDLAGTPTHYLYRELHVALDTKRKGFPACRKDMLFINPNIAGTEVFQRL